MLLLALWIQRPPLLYPTAPFPLLLQRLYYVREAHGIVVTAVAFLPETPELLRDNEAALLSVAVDSRCRLHRIPCRRMLREGEREGGEAAPLGGTWGT